MSERPTPETDEALYPLNQVDIVWPDFARKLERERDEAREAWYQMQSSFERSRDEVERVIRERDKWEETARLYCQNSDYHQEMREKAERERDEARAEAAMWKGIVASRVPRSVIKTSTKIRGGKIILLPNGNDLCACGGELITERDPRVLALSGEPEWVTFCSKCSYHTEACWSAEMSKKRFLQRQNFLMEQQLAGARPLDGMNQNDT
jgi:hypothetical protein